MAVRRGVKLVDARRGLERHDLLPLQVQMGKAVLSAALNQKVVAHLFFRQEAVGQRNKPQVKRLIQVLPKHFTYRRDLTRRREAAVPHDLAELTVQQVDDRRRRFRAKIQGSWAAQDESREDRPLSMCCSVLSLRTKNGPRFCSPLYPCVPSRLCHGGNVRSCAQHVSMQTSLRA